MTRQLASRRRSVIVGVALLMLAPAASARARYCEDWSQTMRLVTIVPEIEMPNGCQVVGDWCYGIGPNSFVIASLADPAAPRFCARFDGLPPINDFVATETQAYLACADSTLRVIDVSVPTLPRAAGTLALSAAPQAVAMYSGLVALAGGSRFWLVDAARAPGIRVIGETETIEAVDLALTGSYALVTGQAGIATIDLADPTSPVAVALFSENIPAQGLPPGRHPSFAAVAVSADRAFLSCRQWEYMSDEHYGAWALRPCVLLLDVSNPLALANVAWRCHYEETTAVMLRGDLALSGRGRSFTVIDPGTLEARGSLMLPQPIGAGIGLQSPYAYVSVPGRGLGVVDLTYPRTVMPLATFGEWESLGGSARYRVMRYVYNGPAGTMNRYQIYDLRDPRNPLLRVTAGSSLNPLCYVGLQSVSGDLVSLDCQDCGSEDIRLLLYDMSGDPPELADIPYLNASLQLDGRVAWLTTENATLVALDCTSIHAPIVLSEVPHPEPAGRLVLGATRACIVSFDELWALDLTNPEQPHVGGAMTLPPAYRDCAVDGERAIMVGAHGSMSTLLEIVDLEEVDAPALVGSLPLEMGSGRVVIGDSWVAVTFGRWTAGGVQIVSVADPTSPELLAVVPPHELNLRTAGTLVCSGDLLYLPTDEGLHLYDLTDPRHPVLLGRATGAALRMYASPHALVTDHHTYPLDCRDALPVLVSGFDVAERDGAVWLTWRSPIGAESFRVEARRAGENWPVPVSAEGEELQACDRSENVAGGGEITYTLFAQQDEGWQQVAQTTITLGGVPSAIALHGAFPNPFNPGTTVRFALDQAREVELAVHDLRGRRAATVAAGRFTAGEHEVAWDGRGAGGAALASGQYVLRLVIDGGAVTRSAKLVLLR